MKDHNDAYMKKIEEEVQRLSDKNEKLQDRLTKYEKRFGDIDTVDTQVSFGPLEGDSCVGAIENSLTGFNYQASFINTSVDKTIISGTVEWQDEALDGLRRIINEQIEASKPKKKSWYFWRKN